MLSAKFISTNLLYKFSKYVIIESGVTQSVKKEEFMADISAKITRKSLKAKKKSAIKTIKAQAKEKIKEIKIQYDTNPERLKARTAEKETKKALRIQKKNARLAYNAKQPRVYTVGEEVFSSISHGIGVGLSAAAIVLLIIRAVFASGDVQTRTLYVTACSIFGSALFATYLMSTLYHAITNPSSRKVFSVLSHVLIYYLIGATYTPFVLFRLSSPAEWIYFGIIWGVLGFFAVLYAIFGRRLRTFSFFSYVIAGWLMIILYGFLGGATIPFVSRVFVIVGGIIYSCGIFFFLMRKVKWSHSIYHLFALGGSVMHFFAVYYLFG